MARLPFGLLLLVPALLSAKPRPSPERQLLDKNIAQLGGYAPFQRLETLTYDIKEAVQASSGTVTRTAQRALQVREEGGFRLWERRDDGTVTVVSSSSPETDAGRALLADTFWLFAPQWVLKSGRPMETLSAGFFLGRLLDRVAVRGEPLFPGGEDLVFYVDKTDGLILGASFGSPTTYVSLREPQAANGFLLVPGARTYSDGQEKKTRVVKLSKLVVNSYLDDTLFSQGATP
jgi:hypothetical protein